MQNCKNFTLSLGSLAAASGPAPAKMTSIAGRRTITQQQVRRSLSGATSKKKGRTVTGAGEPLIKQTAAAPSVSWAREQSTTRPSLAASQERLALRSEPAYDEHHQPALDEQPTSNNQQQSQVRSKSQAESIDRRQLLEAHKFSQRHLGPREEEISSMLSTLGYANLDELISDTIPDQIRLKRELRLPEALSEHELLEQLGELARDNEAPEWRSFIGQGYYDTVTPPVILRNMFENPGWTTAYTAYQAEIAQGRLESLMNYQTMVADLTGLDVANASLLDESTAAAEAMQVCHRASKNGRNKFLVSSRCHPQTQTVLEARAQALGIQVDYFDELAESPFKNSKLSEYFGCLVQYPNTNGFLFDLNQVTAPCHAAGCLVVAATDLLACTLFKPPGDFEQPADLAIGSSQRLGVPLNFGGPHAAFMACKQSLIRSIPGRIVGLTRDSAGNRAYRFALQTREQHIRRDKATSNICTAQALLANMSAMYAVYHGPEGLREIAASIHSKTNLLARLIQRAANGQQQPTTALVNGDSFFDTLTLRVADQSSLRRRAQEAKINLSYSPDGEHVCLSLDETTKLADIFRLANLFAGEQQAASPPPPTNTLDRLSSDSTATAPVNSKLSALKRQSAYLTHPVFNTHRSEAQLVRYMKSLENKDISLTHSMIPLGSCTMKLNATSQMLASSWPEFTKCHPYQPSEQTRGYLRLFEQLDEYLCEITGYDKISFQPNSGAQGEYAGLRVIRAYLESIGQTQRNVCLIPISAHGTNPASAQMAGFKIHTIKVLEDGNIDLEDLAKNVARFSDQLACLMITYPSTFGVFESSVKQVCEMVHEAGGQVYLDGANMNAQVGLCRPGDYGSDVSHLNLHKTFCIPHGGGGPGAGPIGVKSHLIPFLPSHPLSGARRGEKPHRSATEVADQSFGPVSASMWGSPAILPISWSYIRLMSGDLKRASQVAILNANYMRKRLEGAYKILFKGERGNVAHEFIIDCRPFKKTTNCEAVDIAKRLQDFGFHAPTVSWPVANTLMVEPTESEDKHQLDNYCEALLQIRRELADIESGKMDKLDNPIKNAPHTQQIVCSSHWTRGYTREQAAFPVSFVNPSNKIWPTVGRVDDTYGDTNLFCSCQPPAESTDRAEQQQQ